MTAAFEQFREAIAGSGLTRPAELVADGKLHRFASNGTHGDLAGWYVLHGDGVPAGAFGDWRTGVCGTWHANVGRRLSPEEERACRERIASAQRQRDALLAKEREAVVAYARQIWDEAQPATEQHPYLQKKGVLPHGIRERNGRLVIPIRDGPRLCSLQFVSPDGKQKRFLKYGAVVGGYFGMGKPNGTLCVVEGFATGASVHEDTGHAVAVAFNAGNLESVARALRAKFPEIKLIVGADDDVDTPGNPGLVKAIAAAKAVNGLIAIPDFGSDRPARATDFNDLHRHRGAAAVERAVANAKPPEDRPATLGAAARALQSWVAELALLPVLEYEQVRDSEAEKLGVRVSVLDVEVRKARAAASGENKAGETLQFEKREAWPDAVQGDALLAELADSARRYLILPDLGEVALALWVLFTYTIDAADAAPILALVSPEKRCGKSTVLAWLTRLVRNPLPASNVSPAALFRSIEKWQPTLLIDEADTFLRDNEELRGLLNSGHTRSMAYAVRVEGEAREVKRFSTLGC